MTKRMNDEEFMEALDRRRHKADAKAEARMDRREREEAAYREELEAHKIGVLIQEGKTVHYIITRTGKTKIGTRAALIDFMVRNNYRWDE